MWLYVNAFKIVIVSVSSVQVSDHWHSHKFSVLITFVLLLFFSSFFSLCLSHGLKMNKNISFFSFCVSSTKTHTRLDRDRTTFSFKQRQWKTNKTNKIISYVRHLVGVSNGCFTSFFSCFITCSSIRAHIHITNIFFFSQYIFYFSLKFYYVFFYCFEIECAIVLQKNILFLIFFA